MKTKKDMVKSVEQGRRMEERKKGERVRLHFNLPSIILDLVKTCFRIIRD